MNLILGNKTVPFSGLEGLLISESPPNDPKNWVRVDYSDVSSISEACLKLSRFSMEFDTLFILPTEFSINNLGVVFDFLDLNREFSRNLSFISVAAATLLNTFQIKQTTICTSPKHNSFWNKMQRQMVAEYLKLGDFNTDLEIFD